MNTAFYRTLMLLALMAATASAQITTGSITGVVSDPTGAVIPGATVTATDRSTNKEYSTTSGSEGAFVISQVPFGFYKVVVKAKGFSDEVIENVQVNLGQSSHVSARMEVGTTGTVVVVTAEQARVQVDSVEIKNSIDRRQILNMPLPTRNPLDLVRGMAGTTMSGSDLFVHGLRPNTVNLMQDGVNISDNYVKTSGFFSLIGATVDSVGEFTVSTSASGTDSGFGSTQVNIGTTRGTNSLHGSVYWFQRTSYLNANSYLNGLTKQPTPFQLQNRIGYQIGGPLNIPKIYNGKNRTFFFHNFELFREPVQQNTNRLILSDAARTGLFTYTPLAGGAPRTVNLLTGAGMTGGIGGRVGGAAAGINSQVMTYYNSIVPPANNTNCANSDGTLGNMSCFTWNVPGSNKSQRYVARIDQLIGANHTASFVYNELQTKNESDFLNGDFPFFPKAKGAGQGGKRELFSWSFHSNFGANKTNTATFGIQRSPVDFFLEEHYTDSGGFQLFTPGNLSNISGGFNNLPQGRNTPVWEASDNFGWVKGNHNIQFGGDYRRVYASNYLFNSLPPIVQLGNSTANPDGLTGGATGSFPGGISNIGLSNAQNVFDTITGLLSSVAQGFNHTSATSAFVAGKPRIVDPQQHNFAFFVQDNWKFRPNLTLQYGLRWEFQGVFDSKSGLILQPDNRLQGVFGPAPIGDVSGPVGTPAASDVLFGLAGGHNGKPLYNRDWNNFAPFAGFAWDPFGNGKTAVRAGFSTHFANDGFTLFAPSATTNPGLFTTVTNSTPTGVFNSSAVPTPATPANVFPVSARGNFGNGSTAALSSDSIFNKNLATPYVLEWNFAIQREIGKQITVEARYVGNRAVKLFRTTNYNELNLLNNPFTAGGATVANVLTEFQNAQNNLAICISAGVCKGTTAAPNDFSNKGLPGQVPLPILTTLFAAPVLASAGFTNNGFVNNLQQGQVGAMFDTLRRSPTYYNNRQNFPLNFFVPNPWVNLSQLTENSSWSDYHGVEVEVRRRFASGLFFQANYTYSKTLTDQRYTTNQTESQSYLSLANRRADKFRATFDATHNIAGSFIYPLPFGRGQFLGTNAGPLLDALIGGWNFQGAANWSTGLPYTLLSNRQTTGSLVGAPAVLRNMSVSELKKHLGVFKVPGAVFFIDPNSGLLTIKSTTDPTTGIVSVTSTAVMCGTAGLSPTAPCWDHPVAGQYGNMPFQGINGPNFFSTTASIVKRFPVSKISEQFNVELRLEAFNAFNHANWTSPQGATGAIITSAQFGRLTSQVDTARGGAALNRLVQWAVRINF